MCNNITYKADVYREDEYNKITIWQPASQMTKEQSRYSFKEVLDVRVVRVQDLEIKEMQKVTGNNGVEITKPYAEFYNQQMKEIGLERTYQDNDYVFLIETTIT